MSTIIDKLEKAQVKKHPQFDPGDRVRVHFQVIEGTRRRAQIFEGIVIKRQGSGVRETFTVRKQSFGVGVERTFPVHSTKIEKIEVAARGEVRRAKLYYLRDRVGKRARVRERAWTPQEQAKADEAVAEAYDEQGPQAEAEPVAPEAADVEAPETGTADPAASGETQSDQAQSEEAQSDEAESKGAEAADDDQASAPEGSAEQEGAAGDGAEQGDGPEDDAAPKAQQQG